MHSAYAIRATAHTSPGQQHAVAERHPTDLTCPTARTPASARSEAVLGRGGLEVPRKLSQVVRIRVRPRFFPKENILSYPQFVSVCGAGRHAVTHGPGRLRVRRRRLPHVPVLASRDFIFCGCPPDRLREPQSAPAQALRRNECAAGEGQRITAPHTYHLCVWRDRERERVNMNTNKNKQINTYQHTHSTASRRNHGTHTHTSTLPRIHSRTHAAETGGSDVAAQVFRA
jgi:hypothetical protein